MILHSLTLLLAAQGAPHEHKLQASYFMGSMLGFVKMQRPQFAYEETQGPCIACCRTYCVTKKLPINDRQSELPWTHYLSSQPATSVDTNSSGQNSTILAF